MKKFFALLLIALCALGALTLLLELQTVRDYFVPTSESVVQSFVSHLSAHHFENALAQLDDSLHDEMQIKGLQELDEKLTEEFGAYEFERGGSAQGDEDKMRYDARLKTTQSGEQAFPFGLERDPQTQLWKISSLDGLEQKIHAAP